MTAKILPFKTANGKTPTPVNAPGQFVGNENATLPRRPPNTELRTREYLSSAEIDSLMAAARNLTRHGHRDATLILLGYRHGLRVSELVSLRWQQVDLKQGVLHVTRAKNGTPSTHPLRGPEIRALRRLEREYSGTYIFSSERKGPLTPAAVRKIVKRAGKAGGLGIDTHPHMLRHSCGYYLANKGADTRSIQAYLGHRSISNTVQYTALSSERFNEFWND